MRDIVPVSRNSSIFSPSPFPTPLTFVLPAFAASLPLDYAITSGKLAAKAGPTTVKGVGKGLGEKIDEFLETGTMSRIAELEAQTGAAA